MSKWRKSVSKNGYDVYITDREDNYNGMMIAGEFPYSVEELLQFVMKEDTFVKANQLIEKMDVIEAFDFSNVCKFLFYLKSHSAYE